MDNIKNTVIAAIVAAFTLQLKDDATTPEQKVTLQGYIDGLTAADTQIGTLNTQAAERDSLIAALNTRLNNLVAGNDDQEDEIRELKIEKSQAIEVIAGLQKQLAEALNVKAKASDKPVGELDGEKYVINSGAHGYGSAQEIADDPAKISAIYKKNGQTIITKLQ